MEVEKYLMFLLKNMENALRDKDIEEFMKILNFLEDTMTLILSNDRRKSR